MKKSDYITARIAPETKEKIEKIAKEQDRTLSYIINKILNEYLKKNSTGE